MFKKIINKSSINYINIVFCTLIIIAIASIFSKYIKFTDKYELIMGIWQVQITISMLSISLFSILTFTNSKEYLGEKISIVLFIKKGIQLSYLEIVIYSIILGICNLIFVIVNSLVAVLFICLINFVLILWLVHLSLDVFINEKKYYVKIEDYIKHKLISEEKYNNRINEYIDNKLEMMNAKEEIKVILSFLKIKNIKESNKEYVLNVIYTSIVSSIKNDRFKNISIIIDFIFQDNKENIGKDIHLKEDYYFNLLSIVVDALENCYYEVDSTHINYKFIDILLDIYCRLYIKAENNENINELLNRIISIIVDINKKGKMTNNYFEFKELFKKLNNSMLKNNIIQPKFFEEILYQYTNSYLEITDIKQCFYKIYSRENKSFLCVPYVTDLIDTIDSNLLEEKKDNDNYLKWRNYFNIISSLRYRIFENISNNKNIKADIYVIIFLILDEEISIAPTQKMHNVHSYRKNKKSYDIVKKMNLGALLKIVYKKGLFNELKMHILKVISNIDINNITYFDYENIINYNLFLCGLLLKDNNDELLKILISNEIKTLNSNLFSNNEFKRYLIKYIYQYEFFNYNYIGKYENYYKTILVFNCLVNNEELVQDLIDNNTNLSSLELKNIDFKKVIEINRRLNIKINVDEKIIENLFQKIIKEIEINNILQKFRKEKYKNLYEKADIVFKEEVEKYISKFQINKDEVLVINNIVKEINIETYINFGGYSLNNYSVLAYSEAFNDYKTYSNMDIIKREIFREIKKELISNGIVNKENNYNDLESMIKDNNIKIVIELLNLNVFPINKQDKEILISILFNDKESVNVLVNAKHIKLNRDEYRQLINKTVYKIVFKLKVQF